MHRGESEHIGPKIRLQGFLVLAIVTAAISVWISLRMPCDSALFRMATVRELPARCLSEYSK